MAAISPIKYSFSVIDEAGPFVNAMLISRHDWQRKALKSAGWFGQQETKKGIRSGAPGGKRYPAGIGSNNQSKLEQKRGRFLPLGRLGNAVSYQYTEGKVEFGWQSSSAIYLGSKLEKGASIAVTEGMRKKFFASGLYISKNTNILQIPQMPTFDPMAQFLENKFGPYMEEKILEYMGKELRYTPRQIFLGGK